MKSSNSPSQNGLKIIIVGCGKVGITLIEQLSKEGHDITVVDKNPQKIQSIAELYDIMCIEGNGASFSVLIEAGIDNTDLVIAVTDSDELNILCCTVAKKVSKCAAIARVRTPDYNEDVAYLREKLGLAMIINPELETAIEAARILYLPTALEVNSFAHGQAELIKFQVPKDNILINMPISEMSKHMQTNFVICAIERNGEVIIPKGDFIFQEGDYVSFVSTRLWAREFLKKIGFNTRQVKDCMIVGGGKVAYYLAKNLLNVGVNVKIIEQDKDRCEDLSILLPKATIINGDGSDEGLLNEEGISYAESFVPLTGIDEENILLTLYSKKRSKAKVITKINRIKFKDVINSLDLGSVVYPRLITSEAIIAYVRAKKDSLDSNIETLYHMFDSRVEAIEFRVEKESKVTNIPIMELSLKDHLLICFINRKGKIIIPSGQDQIQVGDTVMIVTTHKGFYDINDILK